MPKIQISQNQANLIEAMDADIDIALGSGVETTTATPVLDGLKDFDLLDTQTQGLLDEDLLISSAVLLKGLNIHAPLPSNINTIADGITVVVPLAKLTDLGTQGSLTFTNGILTAVENPT